MKRTLDIVSSSLGLLLLFPVFCVVSCLIWAGDRHNPIYMAPRVGRGGHPFKMVKLRSMRVHADQTGVDSTAQDDARITRVGRVIRKLKLDELSQLWNVLKGDMSLVGPRPNVERDVRLYSDLERRLLGVRPGITDFASVVFADEGKILEGSDDPDLRYNQVIRPWKSRLGLHYVECHDAGIDLKLILITLINAFSRRLALRLVAGLLEQTGADPEVVVVARRDRALEPTPPPGLSEIVRIRPNGVV